VKDLLDERRQYISRLKYLEGELEKCKQDIEHHQYTFNQDKKKDQLKIQLLEREVDELRFYQGLEKKEQ